MHRRTLMAMAMAMAMAAPGGAMAQATPDSVVDRVVLETAAGTIVIETDARAPQTSANFLRYVDEQRFDGTAFYRGMPLPQDTGLIQGGTRYAPGRILAPVAHESTRETGLSHVDGAVSMAREAPGTATGDFFIIVGDVRGLDAGPADPDGFAVFGRVVEGMDVVRAILVAPKSETAGEGFMRGQMLEPEIPITSARRQARPETAPQ